MKPENSSNPSSPTDSTPPSASSTSSSTYLVMDDVIADPLPPQQQEAIMEIARKGRHHHLNAFAPGAIDRFLFMPRSFMDDLHMTKPPAKKSNPTV